MILGLAFLTFLLSPVRSSVQGAGTDLPGRWDLSIQGPDSKFPGWLEVRREGGSLVGRLQWGWGHATALTGITTSGDSFEFEWPDESNPKAEPSRAKGRASRGAHTSLTATLTGGDGVVYSVTGVPAPLLLATPSDTAAWGAPVDLLAGGLEGWAARGEKNGWTLSGGVLANVMPSSDLISRITFRNFKLHLEVEIPPGGNSGIYLRGRHEVQVVDSYRKPAGSREMGGIYGQVTPTVNASRPAGGWQSFDITLTGRWVKVVLNGTTIIDFEEIPGITGGALDSDEAAPGPLMLQGDHTGIRYRNLVVTPAVRDNPAERAVRQFELGRFAAMLRGDTVALRPMLAEKLSYTHSNTLVETKAMHLAAIGSGRTVYESLGPQGMTYRLIGETVVGHGVVKARGTLSGTAFDVLLRVTTVHVRRGDRWQLAAWQSTRIP